MPSAVTLDTCGRLRSPATLSSFHKGRPPRNEGERYPADPPTVGEIVAVMRAAGDDAAAIRLRGLIVLLWRAGLRIMLPPKLGPALHVKHTLLPGSINTNRARVNRPPDASTAALNRGASSTGRGG